MLNQVRVDSQYDTWFHTLGVEDNSGYTLLAVDGLGPVPATISTSPFAMYDGSKWSRSRIGERVITITVLFTGNDISGLRRQMYKVFPVKEKVKLTLTENRSHGELSRTIEGYVEKHEVDIFTQSQGAVVTILCPSPFFEHRMQDVDINPTNPNTDIFNPTNNVLGIELTAVFNNNTNALHLRNNDTLEEWRFEVAGGFNAADVYTVSSVNQNKYARLRRLGKETNVLYSLGSDPKWMTLQPGRNRLQVIAGYLSLQSLRVSYSELYEGF